MRSIELFAGAGGLALGIHQAGYQHDLIVEWNQDAVNTLLRNRDHLGLRDSTVITKIDARSENYRPFEGKVDLLSGGPPCQPFSVGGLHQGNLDERDLFPEVFRAIREIRPKAVIIENVRGLARARFVEYVDYIRLRMSLPKMLPLPRESWTDHRSRLTNELKSSSASLKYSVSFHRANAANYGVPQKRERVFFVAWRQDLNVRWQFTQPSHGRDRLSRDQWVGGDYWNRHGIPPRSESELNPSQLARIQTLRDAECPPTEQPWITIRDAFIGLPIISDFEVDPNDANHFINPGARSYKGHTGSVLDEPSKTLKAGDHGVPGGENTLRGENGTVRYFSVRECGQLQSFPRSYHFTGAWCEAMRQVGNAVPVKLARIIAESIASSIKGCETEDAPLTSRGIVALPNDIPFRTLERANEKSPTLQSVRKKSPG